MPKLKLVKDVKKIEKKPVAPVKVVVVPKNIKPTPEVLRGMRDILPNEWNYFEFLIKKLENLAHVYGFNRIELPIMEPLSLYVRGTGKFTDVVQKEMFKFGDEESGEIAMRPEGTPGVARAYIGHGMLNLPQPVKLYYVGSFFRRERPQAGRHREFHQFGLEIFGSDHPVSDAELIALAHRFFKGIGVPVTFQVNSIGTPASREKFIKELIEYYKPKRKLLCENCKERLTKNPLRLLDCKEPGCLTIKTDAPQIVDFIDEESKAHFMCVLESLGGRPTKAVGFALGLERIINKMKELQIRVPSRNGEIFLAQLGEAARKVALKMMPQLEETGFKIHVNFSKDGLRDKLEQANKLGAKIVLILGQQEIQDGTVIIRDMDSGMQESVDIKKLAAALIKRLPKVE